MEPTNALGREGEPAAAGVAPPGDSGLLEEVNSLWHELRGLVHDRLTLAALETRLAGESLVTMVAAGVMVAALLVSTWLGLMGAAVLLLINIGVMASIAMLVAVAANLVFALILYDVIRRQSRHLRRSTVFVPYRPSSRAPKTPIMRQRHKSASLRVQVVQAERQVLRSRRVVGMRAGRVGRNVRGKLTSPATMLLAGGIGIAAGHFPKRPPSTPGNAERPRAFYKKLFERALKLIALARILSRVFPSAEADPSIQSGLPGQAPEPRFRSAAA